MAVVNVHQAKTQLSRLLARVEEGEQVIIARNGKPVAELLCITKRGKPKFGSWKGRVSVDDGFLEPLSEQELAAWEGG